MGSVKNLTVLKAPTKSQSGRGRFYFSDRYSVFDWGEMPDHINQKGAALCITAAYFFELLKKEGIFTHYLGLVEAGETKKLSQINHPVKVLETILFRVLTPEFNEKEGYDYSIYQQEKNNYLIPLEVIYRNSLPHGSSVFGRLKNGQLTLEDFGINQMPSQGELLKKPFLDVSTKLEASDRYLNWQEAQNISNLSEHKIAEIKFLTKRINHIITKTVHQVGLENEDGKFEFALDQDQNLILVDVFGTLDECRFTYQGIPVSKEIARLYYRQSQWYQEICQAKEKSYSHWKDLIRRNPEPLPPRLKLLISRVYCAFTNEVTGKEWFKDIPTLQETLDEIKIFFIDVQNINRY